MRDGEAGQKGLFRLKELSMSRENKDEILAFLDVYVCSVALLFIMFYGGFGTRWEAVKPV